MPDASVPVTVVVGTGGADIATVVVKTGGGGAGGRLDVVDRDGGAGGRFDVVDRGEAPDAAVVGVSVVAVSPPPPRVAYTPSTAAAAARTPTAEARIGTARDFRWGGGVLASLLRNCVGACGSTAPRFGDVAAARVGADAG
jgi:hypothetical protein